MRLRLNVNSRVVRIAYINNGMVVEKLGKCINQLVLTLNHLTRELNPTNLYLNMMKQCISTNNHHHKKGHGVIKVIV